MCHLVKEVCKASFTNTFSKLNLSEKSNTDSHSMGQFVRSSVQCLAEVFLQSRGTFYKRSCQDNYLLNSGLKP